MINLTNRASKFDTKYEKTVVAQNKLKLLLKNQI